jgi:RHS repeat-associated protein
MNIRFLTLLLAVSTFGFQSGFSECQSGGGSKCGTNPIIKFRGAIYAEVGDQGTVTGIMEVGGVSVNSVTPPEPGRYLVMMPEESGSGEASTMAEIETEPEVVHTGKIVATATHGGDNGSSASWILGLFDTENDCDLDLEVAIKTSSNPDTWAEWEKKRAILDSIPAESGTKTFEFRVRFHKKDDDESGGTQSDNGDGSSTAGDGMGESYDPDIPEEQQDQPPAVPGGLPNQLSPAGFRTSLHLGATADSEGYNTGTLWFSGPISPGLADVSKLQVIDPDETALSVIRNGADLRQVTNFKRLANILPIPTGGFSVSFYESENFETQLTGGLYPITGGPSVVVNYVPVAADSPNHYGGIRVTAMGPNQVTREREILATSSTGESWREVIDGGAEIRNMTCVFIYAGNHWTRIYETTVTRGGILVSKTEKTQLYQYRRAGTPAVMVENQRFELESKTYDSAGTSVSSIREPVPGKIGVIKSVQHPDGSWEAYNYYDGTEPGSHPLWKGMLKETLRPWNGAPASPATASAANSESTIITYTQPGDADGLVPQTRTTTVPGSANPVSKWTRTTSALAISSLANILQLAGVHYDWIPNSSDIELEAGEQHASDTESLASASYTYKDSHVPGSPWIGSSFASLDEEGNGSVTGYERGTFNVSTGEFTVNDPYDNSNWGTDTRATTVKVMSNNLPNDYEGTKETVISDWKGRKLRSELWILTDSATWPATWDLATATTYEYPVLWADGSPKQTVVKQDGRVISETNADSATQTTTIDEQGIKTITVTDAQGRTATVTKEGIGSQPDIVTSYNYSGLTTTVTTSAAGLSRSHSSTVDLMGRTVSETDPTGAVTSTSYPNGGRDTLTTQPGGLTRLVTRNIDGKTVSVTGTAVVDEAYEYAVLANGNLSTTRRMGDLANSPRYSTTVEDWAGRNVSVSSPSPTGSGTVTTTTAYVPGSRTVKSVTSPAGTILHSQPDPLSSRQLSGMDLDANNILDEASMDRVSESSSIYTNMGGYWWEQTTNKTYDAANSSASAVTSWTVRCLHGNPGQYAAWTFNYLPTGGEIETRTQITRAAKSTTTTEIQSGVSGAAESVNINGLLATRKEYGHTAPTTWDYDALGQPIREISPRGAVTHKAYFADGSLGTSTDHTGKTTTYTYYPANHASAGKLMTVTNPLGKTTTYTYNALGLLTEESGDAAYKVTYDYDEYGAKNKMWTWRDTSTSDLTEWIYQPGTGLLLEKKDAAGKSVTHTYTASGKPATRTWARGVGTTYAYDPVTGDLTGIDYSDSTPDVTLGGYDRLGRPATIAQAGIGSETLTYHPGQTALNERYYDSAHSLLLGKGIRKNLPHPFGQEAGFVEMDSSSNIVQRTVAYSYSGLNGLLESITDGTQNHTYAYHPNSALISTIHSNSITTAWFRENRYYDTGGRMLGIRSDRMNGTTVVAPISAYAYDYDELGRRVKQTFLDGSKWEYGYNDRSEVTSAIRKTSGGTEITPLNAAYSYDGIGNRLTSSSAVLGDHTYTPNGLNQYTSITSTDTRTAVGRAPSSWNVQVAGVTASRIDEVFYRPLTASNASAPVWQDVVVQRDTGSPTTTQHFWYAPQSVSPTHDFDGNLTNDGRWTYLWDAENRLVQMESTTQATAAGHPYTKLQFVYDWQGRRIARHVWQGGTQASPTFKSSHRWLYDGWNVITEFTATSVIEQLPTRVNTFTWGLDLSGSLQGAGGVGGLLVQTAVSGGVAERASYDGNGNIVAWTKSSASAPTSRREYDAFGNTLVSEGAAPSTFGFSTKMQDTETGLYYYGYRFYDPVTGRWPSRDPIGEEGGVNIYETVRNNLIGLVDAYGLSVFSFSEGGVSQRGTIIRKELIDELNSKIENARVRVREKLKDAENRGTIDSSTFSWFDHKGNEQKLGKGAEAKKEFVKRMEDERFLEQYAFGDSLLGDMDRIQNIGSILVKYEYDVIVYGKHGTLVTDDIPYHKEKRKLNVIARNFEYVVQRVKAGEGVLVICNPDDGFRTVELSWPHWSVRKKSAEGALLVSKCTFEFYAGAARNIKWGIDN